MHAIRWDNQPVEIHFHIISHSTLHNHPGGQCHPSEDDLQITRDAKKILEGLEILVHDHLVIAGNQAYSIAAGRAYPFAPQAEPSLF